MKWGFGCFAHGVLEGMDGEEKKDHYDCSVHLVLDIVLLTATVLNATKVSGGFPGKWSLWLDLYFCFGLASQNKF